MPKARKEEGDLVKNRVGGSRWRCVGVVVWVMSVLLLGFTTNTFAQGSTPSSQPTVLPLVVETIQESDFTNPEGDFESQPGLKVTQTFWWGGESTPHWSQTDQIMQQMSSKLLKSADVSQISVIFKTPNLTPSNAIALGKTFGAKEVLRGNMIRTTHAGRPLNQPLKTLEFKGELLDISAQKAQKIRGFSLKRTFLADSPEKELSLMQEMLATVVAAFSQPTTSTPPDYFSTPVTDNLTISLQKMEQLSDLQQVIQALQDRNDVQSAQVVWVSDNLITLELIPEGKGRIDVSQIAQFLANSRFNTFFLDVEKGPHNDIIIATRIRLNPQP